MSSIYNDSNIKGLISSMDSSIKVLSRNWMLAKKAKLTWDIQTLRRVRGSFGSQTVDLERSWSDYAESFADEISDIESHINSLEYRNELEAALKALGIPLQGDFPNYEFPPFRFSISTDSFEAKLLLGRKQDKTIILNPKELSKWVANRYQKVVGKKFDANRFMKELLAAYRFANTSTYLEKTILWGRAVPLDFIYELLTLRRSGKQEYPKQLYAYELGCLKEQVNLALDGYRFELGFARNQSKAIVIVDSHGRESRVSSLTIYREAG